MHTVETHRLQLRMFAPSDLDDLCRLLRDPEVIRYVGTGEPILEEEAGTILTSILAHWERHGYGRWAAVDKATENFIVWRLRTLIDTGGRYHLAKSRWGWGWRQDGTARSVRILDTDSKRLAVASLKRGIIHSGKRRDAVPERETDYGRRSAI